MAKKTNNIKIPNMAKVDKAASADAGDAAKSLELVERMIVSTASQYQTAVQWVAEVKDKFNIVEGKRREFVDPLNGVIDGINAFFRPVLDNLGDAEKLIKAQMSGFATSQALRRDDLLKRAGAEGEGGDPVAAERLIDEAETHMVPKVKGVSLRESWDGEVVDADKLPAEYLIQVPDLKALRARTKSVDGDPQIPGWRAYPKTSVVITVDKIKR